MLIDYINSKVQIGQEIVEFEDEKENKLMKRRSCV